MQYAHVQSTCSSTCANTTLESAAELLLVFIIRILSSALAERYSVVAHVVSFLQSRLDMSLHEAQLCRIHVPYHNVSIVNLIAA